MLYALIHTYTHTHIHTYIHTHSTFYQDNTPSQSRLVTLTLSHQHNTPSQSRLIIHTLTFTTNTNTTHPLHPDLSHSSFLTNTQTLFIQTYYSHTHSHIYHQHNTPSQSRLVKFGATARCALAITKGVKYWGWLLALAKQQESASLQQLREYHLQLYPHLPRPR